MSDHAVPDHTWIAEAPIRFMPFAEAELRIRRFIANVGNRGRVGGGTALADRLNTHEAGAGFIAGLMIKDLLPYRPVFKHRLAGEPIALPQPHLGGGVMEINNLATHPGSQMAGGVMVEFALNRSPHCNSQGLRMPEGVIRLESCDDASTAAYLALGFTQDRHRTRGMTLDAAESDKWSKVGTHWRLAAHAARKHLATGTG